VAVGPESIDTSRLVLLPLLAGHPDEMAAVLSDPRLYTFTGGGPLTPRALRPAIACRGPADPARAVTGTRR